MLPDEGLGSEADVFVAAAAFEPLNLGLAAKPGALAFGVVAMALLGLGDGGFAGQLVAQDGHGFGVTQRGERSAVVAVAFDEAGSFFDESAVEHLCGTLVDTLVEAGAGRIEAEAEDAVAGEGIAALLPLLGEGLSGCERDFNGADYFGDVVAVDGFGGGFIEAGEDFVEVDGPAGGGEVAEALALAGLDGRRGEEAVDEGSEVESGAAGDDGEVAARGDSGDGFAGQAAVVAGGAELVGVNDVDEVVGDHGALLRGWLGCANLHLAIDGY